MMDRRLKQMDASTDDILMSDLLSAHSQACRKIYITTLTADHFPTRSSNPIPLHQTYHLEQYSLSGPQK